MMNAVARRPTPAAQPKPEARALVGNTSEAKICMSQKTLGASAPRMVNIPNSRRLNW